MSADKIMKMPTTVASRKGIGHLTTEASEKTVVLTNHGHPVAVVMSPQEYDEHVRMLREAADSVLASGAALLAERSEFISSDEAKGRLAGR